MPTYDYECDACGHEFELFQQISESPKKKCPACRKPKLRRLFGTGAALMFKGSGFYKTDYRSEAYKKAAAAESKPAADSASSEAKPAAEGGSGEPSKSKQADSAAASAKKPKSSD